VLNNSYDELSIGSEVRFDEEKGCEGPQASTVAVLGKHHIVE
jgi:cold shock CspA family protein